jgi:hypothetical protein
LGILKMRRSATFRIAEARCRPKVEMSPLAAK